MNAPDLRTNPPRRWSDEVDGVIWLPRFAEKARAFDAGTLGNYLFGHSPIDEAFLRRSRLDYAAFQAIVRAESDDAAVLAAIERASPGATERLRNWSGKARHKLALFFRFLDLDDGYASPWWMAVAAPVIRGGAFVVARAARKYRRSGLEAGASSAR
jgi:hypothetical protein